MNDPLGTWMNVRFDHDTHFQVTRIAAASGTTRAVIVREAVRQYLARLVPDIQGRDL